MKLSEAITLAVSRLRNSTETTRKWRLSHIHLLVDHFGDIPVSEFSGVAGYKLLQLYIDSEVLRGNTLHTCHKRMVTLNLTLCEAVRMGELAAMPPMPRMQMGYTPRSTYLTRVEAVALRLALPTRRRLWFDVALHTAQHASDVSTMTWDHLNLHASTFLRRNTKSKAKEVWLRLPMALRASLLNENCRAGLVVGPWRDASRDLSAAAKRAGLGKRITPNDLRRTFATWWSEKGGNMDYLRQWLGHSSRSIMVETVYAQTSAASVSRELERLDTSVSGEGPDGVHELLTRGGVEAHS